MKVLGSPSVARLALTTLVALSVLPVMSGLVHAEFQGQLRVLALRDQLSANSIEDRRNAIRELTKMEGHAAIATDALLELLADPQLGSDVQKALLAIGPTALSKLGEHLQHADASRRVAALQCIATFGRYGRRVETSVVAALGDKEANVQVAALRVLTRLHPANSAVIPNLLQQLSHEDSQRRELAAITLREMGLRAKSTVPELAIALGDKSPRVRALTSEALGRMGPYARPALPALSALFADSDSAVWQAAASAVANTWEHPGGEAFVEPLPTLVRYLQSDNRKERTAALRACFLLPGRVVRNNLEQHVLERLSDEDTEVLRSALSVVDFQRIEGTGFATAVCRLAEHSDDDVRFLAFQALTAVKPSPEQGKAAILAGLRHAEPSTRRAAVEAAPQVCAGDADVVDALLTMLNKNEEFGSMMLSTPIVARSLSRMGDKVKDPLLRRLHDSNLDSRFGAVDALGELGRHAEPALPALAEMLDERGISNYQQSLLLNAILKIGLADNEPIARKIAAQLDADDSYDREYAVRILATADKSLWPKLVGQISKRLDDDEERVVRTTVNALGKFGTASLPAASKLAEVAEQNGGTSLALAALKALWQIRGANNDLVYDVGYGLERAGTRAEAAELLSQIGPAAECVYAKMVAKLGMSDSRTDAFLAKALTHFPNRKQESLVAMRRAIEVSERSEVVTIATAMHTLGAPSSLLKPYVEDALHQPNDQLEQQATQLLRILENPD